MKSVLLAVCMVLLVAPIVCAQTDPADNTRTIPITGDRLTGFVLPIEPLPGDISLTAQRGWSWTIDDTKRLRLQGDVDIRVGRYRFQGDDALVWLNRIPSADGLINQVAIFFDQVRAPGSPAGLGVNGEEILITGSARGGITLRVDLLTQAPSPRSSFLTRGQRRLADHLKRLLVDRQTLNRVPQIERPEEEPLFRPTPGEAPPESALVLPEAIELPGLTADRPWLRAPEGAVRFLANRIEVTTGETENVITASGSIVIEYISRDPDEDFRQITLTAEHAVIFAEPGTFEEIAEQELSVEFVRGIYLEGNVIANADPGDYMVRAPKVYYDFDTDQAIMLNAVLRTYVRRNIPVYARAEEMRQIAENQWETKNVRVSASEFAVGHIAIGADRATVTQRPRRSNPTENETFVDARDLTLRGSGTPLLWWPRFAGTLRSIPLKSVTVGTEQNTDFSVESRWNLFGLLGIEQPDDVDATLKVDGFVGRGAALGLEFRLDGSVNRGVIDLYGLYDDGVDRTSAGLRVEPDTSFRGVALAENRTQLARNWELQTQVSWISDPTFITTWRENDFRERREYETSAFLKYQEANVAFTLLTQYELNNFISNDWLLASRPYKVDRLPELIYRRYGDSIFGDRATYSTETRLSRMRFVVESNTPAELGVRSAAFGIDPDTPVNQAPQFANLPTQYVSRFDTRHEIAFPGEIGPVQFTPFVVGRLTWYDDDFDEFAGDDNDSNRAYAAIGLRVHTELFHVDNSVESRVFDLHRVRHIIEPNATLWYGYSDVDQSNLPVYDPEVESLADGAVVRMGVRNRWQTMRGGPGRWRSVDFLVINTDVVFNSSEIDRESPAPQFFDFRPESSQFGDHVFLSGAWLVSDTFSLNGRGVYDLDESAVARGAVGFELRHSPRLITFAEFRYLDASDNELIVFGWNYELSRKYRVAFRPQWDLNADEFRAITLVVTRTFPDYDFIVSVRHDEIRNDTSIGAQLRLITF